MLAMQLHPLAGRGPVHQRTIISYLSRQVTRVGRLRENIRLGNQQLLRYVKTMRTETVQIDGRDL